ncbi:peptidase inhibitor family I36 protein [Streptomyces sp. NRRL B-24085]|uniref:peptidase inhibitor family I36 protein n=1 Tax=Streptomyces sp. NRRL B-24085 TaxID=1709476 RepID=UPI0006B31A18|nr:peptidase inhibitor family I36 protein [Streptomyces sp. NRRL B-24085]
MSASPRKISTGLAGLALAGLSILAAPGIAGAAEAPVPTPGSKSAASAAAADSSAVAADGYFYAWEGANRTGNYCRWVGNDTDWTTCSPGGNMRNQASSIENRGYPGSYANVVVYWDTGYGGANACIDNGWYYADLSQWFFPNNGPGQGETLNDNISSHQWTNAICEGP